MIARTTAFTHRGRVRANNEDTVAVGEWISEADMRAPLKLRHELSSPLVCVIADGMGGHAAGEVASRYVARRLAGEPEELIDARAAARTLKTIHAELYQAMQADADLLGMGSTAVGLVLAPLLVWFNVGDSRLYRYERGRLVQMSIDDTPPGPRSGLLTQSLGGALPPVGIAPHVGEAPLAVPARFLLCSDGLTDMLADDDIEDCMKLGDADAVAEMFELAMRAGGYDNISIIVASVE
ncbi:MAG TPA: protein phosphatase 2C domain-containing protein [Xanthobacteraceae bacterium]|nr:protein phosphatase 2C domain-containing protein [Xanthobacteraceae bacterium]